MSTTLHYGDRSSEVAELKRALNCRSNTRLPRLYPNDLYDVLTMARVMETQHQLGLKADGIAGSATRGRIERGQTSCRTTPLPDFFDAAGAFIPPAFRPDDPAAFNDPALRSPRGRCIMVDLISNQLFAYADGMQVYRITPIRGGSATHPSDRGVFQMSRRRLRNHTSSVYPIPPGNMDFSLFYNGGEAIHQGPPAYESHGCIHVGPPDAETLFNWAGTSDILVIVVKLSR